MTKNTPNCVTTGVLTIKLGGSYDLTLPDAAADSWKGQWRPYVIAEYQGFQLSSEALFSLPAKGVVSWEAWYRPLKFDLPPSLGTEEEQEGVLTLSLLIRRHEPDTASTLSSSRETFVPQCMSLGWIRLNPFLAGSGRQKVDVLNGTGQETLEISYTEKEIPPVITSKDWRVPERNKTCSDGNLVYVQKRDSGRSYGIEVVHIPCSSHEQHSGEDKPGINSLRSNIQHPFIAPLTFAFFSSDGRLELLSPLGSGGYLSNHVQRERRFGVTKARYYAAELICTLEYLHAKNIILGSLKMENILLDSSGHASLCKPSLFALDLCKDTGCIAPGTAAYPAPETLNNKEPSRAGDWWSLGIILYELLTGAPPFYHKDEEERRYRIIHDDLQLPVGLPSSANDILTGLLDKDFTRRLGAHGLAEVKAHPFFHGLDWGECIQRKLETPIKPHDDTVVFWREPHTYKVKEYPKGERREIGGAIFEMLGTADFPLPRYIGPAACGKETSKANTGASNEQWELIWADGELYFQNRSFGQRVLAKREAAKRGEIPPPVISEHPTQHQLEEALAAALQTRYSSDVFSQLISYDMNLNIRIHDFKHYPSRWITPLEWAVEQERPDLVHLFLDHGADADFTIPSHEGPAVVRAVRRKLHNLVEVLVQRTTHRVSRTRALALAVEQQDISLATILLSHAGVACDFEESDRPLPPHPYYRDYDSNLSRVFEPRDFTPPLVRAARLGDLALVTLLLKHGADPNVAYHDLGGWRGTEQDDSSIDITTLGDSRIPTMFSCGRAVQIAMEMGYPEVVRALLDAGADIDLPQPAWRVLGHVCQPVPRAAYLEIVSGLRDIVAERRRGINLG